MYFLLEQEIVYRKIGYIMYVFLEPPFTLFNKTNVKHVKIL